MLKEICTKIREQIMFFIDNALDDQSKGTIVKHLENCEECQNYLNNEQEIKKKICQKLKDVYVCKCDIFKLQHSIKEKIQHLTNPKD
jgi:hypothetical protein